MVKSDVGARNTDINIIRGLSNALIDSIRKYSLEQRDLWQRIPSLALEADSRNRHRNNKLAIAYNHGYWHIDSSKGKGTYKVWVDLATGDLVDAPRNPNAHSGDEDVLKLALHRDELDVTAVMANLKRIAEGPYAPGIDFRVQESWRKENIVSLGLEEVFTRK